MMTFNSTSHATFHDGRLVQSSAVGQLAPTTKWHVRQTVVTNARMYQQTFPSLLIELSDCAVQYRNSPQRQVSRTKWKPRVCFMNTHHSQFTPRLCFHTYRIGGYTENFRLIGEVRNIPSLVNRVCRRARRMLAGWQLLLVYPGHESGLRRAIGCVESVWRIQQHHFTIRRRGIINLSTASWWFGIEFVNVGKRRRGTTVESTELILEIFFRLEYGWGVQDKKL